MLLAAGRGERMRPLTDRVPKPLLEAGGKPLIVWHIEKLVNAGITDLVINRAHLGTQIRDTLGDGNRYGASIRYSDEGTALETAGGIAYALPLLGDEPFAVINSDIWCDYDFALLAERAEALQAGDDMAHLVLVNNPPHHPNGDFCLVEGRLLPAGGSKLTFSGIGIYRPSLFSRIPRGSAAPLAPLLYEQIAAGRIGGERHDGKWMDVGTPLRLTELDSYLRSSHNAS